MPPGSLQSPFEMQAGIQGTGTGRGITGREMEPRTTPAHDVSNDDRRNRIIIQY